MKKETDFNDDEKRAVTKLTPEQLKDGLIRLSAMREAIQESKERYRQEDTSAELSQYIEQMVRK